MLVKNLLINDEIHFKKLCDRQNAAKYDGEIVREWIFELWSKKIEGL
ncbi:MAG: hypothetical protein PV340_01315 [Wolbachia sp.]|nr:hypothetical protein [Wolbachia sp.]